MKSVKLGIGGFGTVGSGLAKILLENGEWIEKRIGKRLEIKTVLVRDLNKARAVELDDTVTFTTDPTAITQDTDIDIVLELMGGVTFAYEFTKDALNAGKHVVTANKHMLAKFGPELFALAAEKGVGLYYESSVAGGIPVVEALKTSLCGDRVESMLGILNGTANYILSEMTTKGLDFKTALSEAQDLGYAEADPTLDIEGHDQAHKLCVLIRLAFGEDYPLDKLPIQGITGVTPLDIEFAREFGYRIKLIAHANVINGQIEAGVSPALVPYTYLLARVGGNYNAVRITGKAVGPVMLHGQGAGDLPTGNAVMADVMNLARACSQPDNTGFMNAPLEEADIMPPSEAQSRYYFRFTVTDKPGVMAAIAQAMADHDISIAQAVQKGEAGNVVPVVMITHSARAADVLDVVNKIDAMDFSAEPCVNFRIL